MIKDKIDFEKFPRGLLTFKRVTIFVFLVILITVTSILGINFKAKRLFNNQINSVSKFNKIQNYFSFSKLTLIMMYLYAN